MKPVCYDLYCGLGGWAEGFLAEGFEVVGYDIERHDYGTGGYPGKLVLQDVLDLDGRGLADAAVNRGLAALHRAIVPRDALESGAGA